MKLNNNDRSAVLDALAAKRPFAMIKAWLGIRGHHVRTKADLYTLLYLSQAK